MHPQHEREAEHGGEGGSRRARKAHAHGLQRQGTAVVVHGVAAEGRQRHGEQSERAQGPAAQQLVHARGGLVGQHGGAPQAECLHGDEGHHKAEQCAPEDAWARGGARQVAAEVAGVRSPGQGQTQRDGAGQDERADLVRAVRGPGAGGVDTVEQPPGDQRERGGEHEGHDDLKPVDGLVAQHAEGSLGHQHDQDTEPERPAAQPRERVPAEQPDQRVPGDRGQPLQDAGHRHAAAEGEPGQRQLPGTGLAPPGAQIGGGYCAEDGAQRDGGERGCEVQSEGDADGAGEHAGHGQIGSEPYGEQAPGTAVAVALGDRLYTVRFDTEVAGGRRHPSVEDGLPAVGGQTAGYMRQRHGRHPSASTNWFRFDGCDLSPRMGHPVSGTTDRLTRSLRPSSPGPVLRKDLRQEQLPRTARPACGGGGGQ
ncbi:hypothetical protein GA0115254_126852 [Streptomyces sp. Ncost-T10-10d]|nr:hypothetical protein GA0115254_126852 [Streptomyces sp. Ncost-T10-10d]